MTWSPFTGPETSKAKTYASGTYAHICLKAYPGCEGTEHFPSWQRASLCYLSSICFADVCRLDFLWATCVVTLSRSILWFCRTSSRCLHLQEEAEKKLRKVEFYSEHASQARIPTVRVSARPMEAGIASRKSQRYCRLLAFQPFCEESPQKEQRKLHPRGWRLA